MPNLSNGRMGAASITFGGQNIGHTSGGVTFHYEPHVNDIIFDQYGDTPIDKILGGENVQVVVNLAEPVIDQLQAGIPEGTQQGSGANKRMSIGRDAGFSLRSVAAQLVLHPIDRTASDTTEDVVIYKAVVADTIELNYQVDTQRVYQVTFQALLDETFGSGRRLGHFGTTNVS